MKQLTDSGNVASLASLEFTLAIRRALHVLDQMVAEDVEGDGRGPRSPNKVSVANIASCIFLRLIDDM